MSTYGKLTVPTADIFKSQNNIASLENGKVPVSQIPMDAIKTSLSNTDLTVKSLTVKSDDGGNRYSGKIFQNSLTTDIASQDGDSGIQLYSSENNKRVSEIIIGSTEGSSNGNIVLKSYKPTMYDIGEINILSSDGNSIKLGDGQFKLSSVYTESSIGSEINLTKDNIDIAGANTTTIANNVTGEQITIGSDGITLDSKRSGIVLNGYGDSRLSLAANDVSFTLGSNRQGLTLSEDFPIKLYGGTGKAWLHFASDGSIYLDSEEGVGGIHIRRTSLTTFQNNEFEFIPCTGVTDPVYIKVPVVNSTTNKLDGTYAKLYVSKNSSGTLELKVEAAS